MTHENYIRYFEELAESNVDLLHNSSNRKTFFRANIEEMLEGLSSRRLNFPCMILESFTGRIISDANFFDNPVEAITGAFTILYKVKQNDYDDENDKLEDARTLGMQVIAKMLNDYKTRQKWEDGVTFKIPYFNPSSVSFEKVGPLTDNEFGYRFQFEILDPQYINLKYDADQWQ